MGDSGASDRDNPSRKKTSAARRKVKVKAEGFIIPAEDLRPGQPFQLEVEFSEMDTERRDGLVSILTYAASTFLDIRTTGVNEDPVACPAQPLAMDGGQTDRKKPGG